MTTDNNTEPNYCNNGAWDVARMKEDGRYRMTWNSSKLFKTLQMKRRAEE